MMRISMMVMIIIRLFMSLIIRCIVRMILEKVPLLMNHRFNMGTPTGELPFSTMDISINSTVRIYDIFSNLCYLCFNAHLFIKLYHT